MSVESLYQIPGPYLLHTLNPIINHQAALLSPAEALCEVSKTCTSGKKALYPDRQWQYYLMESASALRKIEARCHLTDTCINKR